uniref:Uncharacterized protein n=1 Tax=Strongyloides stercoralis TaxID=6248 RepID=A0AAF5DKF1_STRER
MVINSKEDFDQYVYSCLSGQNGLEFFDQNYLTLETSVYNENQIELMEINDTEEILKKFCIKMFIKKLLFTCSDLSINHKHVNLIVNMFIEFLFFFEDPTLSFNQLKKIINFSLLELNNINTRFKKENYVENCAEIIDDIKPMKFPDDTYYFVRDQIKSLEMTNLVINGIKYTFKCLCYQADNLELNFLYGLGRTFHGKSTQPCKFCLANCENMNNIFLESNCIMRTENINPYLSDILPMNDVKYLDFCHDYFLRTV